MKPMEIAWLEAQVYTRLNTWCKKLAWLYCQYPDCARIVPGDNHPDFVAMPVSVQGVPSVMLRLGIDSVPIRPWDSGTLLFVLRRNLQLAHVHWACGPSEGLVILGVRGLHLLTADSFRDFALSLITERNDFVALWEDDDRRQQEAQTLLLGLQADTPVIAPGETP